MVNGTKDPVGSVATPVCATNSMLHFSPAPSTQSTRFWRSRRSSSDSRSCGEKTGSSAWKNCRTFVGMSGTAAAKHSAFCSELSRDSADVAASSSAARRRQAPWMLARSAVSMISPDSFSCLLLLPAPPRKRNHSQARAGDICNCTKGFSISIWSDRAASYKSSIVSSADVFTSNNALAVSCVCSSSSKRSSDFRASSEFTGVTPVCYRSCSETVRAVPF